VWALVVLVTVLSAPGLSQSAVSDLLGALDLSAYPTNTKPPAFSGRTPTDQQVALAELRGKVVLLNFWATWCAECRAEMGGFEQLHRAFTSQGLTVVGINAGEEPGTIQRYAQAMGLSFPLILDPQETLKERYGVIGLPATFLIGRDGRAVALATGPREWDSAAARALIEALLAEPTVSLQEAR